jgi:hypothetical protein
MKQKIAVYEDHDSAFGAVEILRKEDFPSKQISVLGKVNKSSNDLHLETKNRLTGAPVVLGVGAGTVLGLLTGLGVFIIPGFGVLYGAGAIIGTLAGFEVGAVGGGLVSLLTTAGIETEQANRHSKHLDDGKFLVFLNGSTEEIERAEELLHTQGTHLELN